MEENNSWGRPSRGRSSRGRSGRMQRGGRGAGRRGEFDRKRHRPRSPVDMMYHRPRFDDYNPYLQPPFENFDTPERPFFPPPHERRFGNHQTDSSNGYEHHHHPPPELDFHEDMSMDQSQHFRGRGNFSRGRGPRGSGRGNNNRGGPPRGSHRGNFPNTGNRGRGNRGTRTNFNQRGGGRGNQGGQFQRGNSRGQSNFHTESDRQKVHSLAKLEMPDPTLMSIAEKLKRFGLYLRSITPKDNAIQTIQNALSASKLLLTAAYDSSVLLLYAGRPMFTGRLHIGGQFIVRAVGPTKKELKHDVYNQVLQILTTENVQAILSRVDRPEELKQTLLDNLQSGVPEPVVSQNDFEASVVPLITALKTLLPAVNSISVLEQARSMSHTPFKSYCTFEECDTGKRYFRSSFWLDNHLIAIGHGKKKKEAKHSAYDNAIKGLTTKSIAELESGKNVEGSSAETEWLESATQLPADSKSPVKDKSLAESPEKGESFNLEKQLTKLVDQLKEYIFKLNNVHTIDCLAVKLALSPVCVYKKIIYKENEAPVLICELYINDIFIASSESTSKKDAQLQAYQKAWEFLTTTPVDSIVSEQPRKTEFNTTDPNIIEVVRKGAGKYGDSNIERLGRYLINVYENWKSVDEIIIMEHIDWLQDRERHAFGILSQSATLSGLLMEWKICKDEEGSRLYKCSMFLQKEEVACGKDATKIGARNKASVIALTKLYQTQPIIQVMKRDETKNVYSWEEIKERAKSWRSYKDDVVPLDASGEPTSEHILNYCKHLLSLMLNEDTLEGVIFQSGMTAPELRGIKQHAASLKMKSDSQTIAGLTDLIVSKKLTPDAMVECLQRNHNKSGRYVLLDDKQRPTLLLSKQPTPDAGENPAATENCVDVLGLVEDSQ